MTVSVAVSGTTVVCIIVEPAGAPPVIVRVMMVGAGMIEVVTVTNFVDVFKAGLHHRLRLLVCRAKAFAETIPNVVSQELRNYILSDRG